ncbi:MAG: biotin--[acetyl-CoA-carboxylase] ligase [Melioribacteraceae bacterium]|nr:biotin--[acetyl-CoA-carboxylase] ligase [Melioribacteraceae bacterium]
MFNIEDFDIKLDTEFIGRNFIYCEEIDSTNSTLLNDNYYKKNGTIILSEFQTNGKGRKRREWLSNKEQNLTFSILLIDDLKPRQVNILNLGASLAVAQSIENLFQLKTNLKWPNDVLIDGKKVSGILIESSSKGDKLEKVALGIGINVNQPNFTGRFNIPPTSIKKEFKKEVSRERVLSEVLNNFEVIYELALKDPKKILNDWKLRSRFLGESIKIEEGESTLYGKFEDIDDDGFMMLRTEKGIEKIHFGDVSLV